VVEFENAITIRVEQDAQPILLEQDVERVVVLGQQGPAGPPGNDGDSAPMQITAGETLGGHRAVVSVAGLAVYADPSDESLCDVIGITTGAASVGELASVHTGGQIVEPSWSWADGPVFAGTAGTLTQSIGSGALIQIGVAVAPTKLLVEIQPTIF
jgi:hypothetical protein